LLDVKVPDEVDVESDVLLEVPLEFDTESLVLVVLPLELKVPLLVLLLLPEKFDVELLVLLLSLLPEKVLVDCELLLELEFLELFVLLCPF